MLTFFHVALTLNYHLQICNGKVGARVGLMEGRDSTFEAIATSGHDVALAKRTYTSTDISYFRPLAC